MKNLQQLKYLYKNGKIALAYALCEKFPYLKKTPQYSKMQQDYRQAFKEAQKFINIGKIEKAKEILKPYKRVVDKQDGINLLLMQNQELIKFLKAIENKEYEIIFKLIKSNKKFKNIDSYKRLQDEIKGIRQEFENSLFEMDVQKAQDCMQELEKIPFANFDIKLAKEKIYHIKEFKRLYDLDDFVACYEFLDKHKNMLVCSLAIMLDKHWDKKISACKELADNGDIEGILDVFGDLLMVDSRQRNIKKILKTALLSKIDKLIRKNSFDDAQKNIYIYNDNFGYDDEILQKMGIFEKLSGVKLAINAKIQSK